MWNKIKAFLIGLVTGLVGALLVWAGVEVKNLKRRKGDKPDHIGEPNKMIRPAPEAKVDDLPEPVNHLAAHEEQGNEQQSRKPIANERLQKDFDRFMRNRE